MADSADSPPPPAATSAAAVAAVCAVGAAIAVLSGLQFYASTNEDAWITLRYARHLADGEGLVSYPGGPTEEGYSNGVLVGLLALARLVGADLVHATKIIGLLAFAATAVAAFICVRAIAGRHRSWVWFAVPPIAASQFLAFWSCQGLETTSYALVVTVLCAWTVAAARRTGRRGLIGLAVLCWLSANLRPEGLMNVGVAFGCLFAIDLANDRGWRSALARPLPALLVFAALTAVQLWAKQWYFGGVVPNPTNVKLAVAHWGNPARYLLEYLAAKGVAFAAALGLLAVAVVAVLLRAARVRAQRAVALRAAVPLAFVASQLYFVAYSGGDYMPYGRFLLTHYPVLVVGAAGMMVCAGRAVVLAPLMAVLLTVSAATERVEHHRWWQLDFADPRIQLQRAGAGHYHAVVDLRARLRDARRPYAASEFGYLPFHVDHAGIDMIGLNDKVLARAFAHYSLAEAVYANRDYVLSKLPHVILGGRYGRAADGGFGMANSVAWFWRPYVESRFFLRNYDTALPAFDPESYEEWIFSDWNGRYASSAMIRADEPEHHDKLMYGFEDRDGGVWCGPLARVLLHRGADQPRLVLAGRTDGSELRVEIAGNGVTIGDRRLARATVRGGFSLAVEAAAAGVGEAEQLITVRVRGEQATAAFALERVGFETR